MFSSNWRQVEQNAKDKIAAQREQDADPVIQARRAMQRQLIYDQDAQYRAEKEKLRLEREGPVRAVADLFRARFPDDLPEIYEVLSKPQGVAKLLPILKAMAAEDVKARRDAADAARREAEHAKMVADGERRVREQAEREAKRKAKAEAETAESEA